MLLRSFRKIAGAASVALIAAIALSPSANAQKGGTGVMNGEVTWPTSFTLGFGAHANDNFQGSGSFYSPSPNAAGDYYNQAPGLATPEFHILAEIPIGTNFMFAPRIAFNDWSLHWLGAVNNPAHGMATSFLALGTDLLFKYSLSNFHIMAGANLSTPIKKTYAETGVVEAATASNADIPNAASFLASLKGGIGYDIPLNGKNTIWLTPEAFFNYPLTNFVQPPSGAVKSELYVTTVSGGASLKFALKGPEEAPPPVALAATISAQGVLPDGSITAEPVVPQQALHTRSSLPLLPYVFFDMGDPAIPARYSRMGATGFSVDQLADKNAIDANHELLDIIGQRLKATPAATITITGTNANTGVEKNNIALSKSRATAVRDYLVSTWGIDAGRITVDQRNLPNLPTNPVTQPGIQENRRAEISSTDESITAPVKIENRSAVNVGETVIRFNTSVSPADHAFSTWQIMLDKDGAQIGQTLSGTGAPPATQTMIIPDAARYVNQPVHYKLIATDAAGMTATADGFTRIVPKTVDRDNLEKYAMLSFDFDKSDINARARQMLALIAESISRDATGVTVAGFCDATGTPEYNQTLSEARANSAVTALRSMTTLPANVSVHGNGLRDPKFSNDLPEGRQLNRRVEFTIEKSSR